MPDDLARQVPIARELLDCLGFQPVGLHDYEADGSRYTGAHWRRSRYARLYFDEIAMRCSSFYDPRSYFDDKDIRKAKSLLPSP